MALRNTQTEKWQWVWFRRLSPEAKLLYTYILDNCDIAGIWTVDVERVAFETGLTAADHPANLFERGVATRPTIEGALAELEPFLIAPSKPLESPLQGATKHFFVKDFLGLQNNLPLNSNNPCHRGIMRRIENANGLQKHILAFLKANEKESPFEGASKPLVRGIGNGNGKGKGNKGGVGGKSTAAELHAEYLAQQAALQEAGA